jgi:hypothetical protein
MANVDEAVAHIVAHHDRTHRWPTHEPGLNEAFVEFLEAWMPHAQERRLHVRLPPTDAFRRSVHVFAMYDEARRATLVTLEINDTYRRTTTPVDGELLEKAALAGDRGRLDDDALWPDPRLQGLLTGFVWWGNEHLWRHCASSGRRASRLAYEVLSGTPWETRFATGTMPAPGDIDRLSRIGRRASEIRDRLMRRTQAIPIRVLRDRGEATMAQAIAHYLVEDPAGPRMSWRDAAHHTGTKEWRTLYAAVRDRARKLGTT